MERKTKAQILSEKIAKFKIAFLNMNEAERLKIIQDYDLLKSYEKVVLIQCKKYMSKSEKEAYKIAMALSQKEESDSQPQP